MAAPPEKEEIRMAVSKAQQASVNKYVKANYDRINVTFPKGRKDEIKAIADTQGQSVNAYIISAVDEKMERDDGGTASETAQNGPESAQGGGVVSLLSETLEIAQRAAEAVGEAVPDFVRRAVETQVQRDQASLRLGINPTMENKLEENQD